MTIYFVQLLVSVIMMWVFRSLYFDREDDRYLYLSLPLVVIVIYDIVVILNNMHS